MTITNLKWGTIHPSVFHIAAGPLRDTKITPRAHGALRYCCPITGGFVLLTDEATLARFKRRRVRLRCSACGEMHLLTREMDSGSELERYPAHANGHSDGKSADIVVRPAKL